jgi:uncharacterized membrane protein YciS (DUF1049 family)
MSVFFDANVVLETMIPGRLKREKALNYIVDCSESRLSALSVHLLFHFGLKLGYSMDNLCSMTRLHKIIDLTGADIDWAMKHCSNRDFEDALQVSMARRAGCVTFVTLDKRLARAYENYISMVIL